MTNEQDMQGIQDTIRSLYERLKDNEAQLSALTDELRNWKRQAHDHCPSCGRFSLTKQKPKTTQFYDLPLSEAVLRCLADYTYPISCRTLRLELEKRGYPKSKFGRYGNYLHTVVWRLKDAGKIQRMDGDEIILA